MLYHIDRMPGLRPPTCVDPQTIQPIRTNQCLRNKQSDAWLSPDWEQSCQNCNPFGIHNNDRLQDGCYKLAFKIPCNEENSAFVKNQWVPHGSTHNLVKGKEAGKPCDTTTITCCSIKTGCCSQNQQGFNGYTVQGSTW